jgi:hypothetical protein
MKIIAFIVALVASLASASQLSVAPATYSAGAEWIPLQVQGPGYILIATEARDPISLVVVSNSGNLEYVYDSSLPPYIQQRLSQTKIPPFIPGVLPAQQ